MIHETLRLDRRSERNRVKVHIRRTGGEYDYDLGGGVRALPGSWDPVSATGVTLSGPHYGGFYVQMRSPTYSSFAF